MFDSEEMLLAEFASVKIAGHLLNIPRSCISRACNSNYTAGGYIWKYK